MSGLGLISLYSDDEDESCDETNQQPMERPQISSSTMNSSSSTPRWVVIPIPLDRPAKCDHKLAFFELSQMKNLSKASARLFLFENHCHSSLVHTFSQLA